VLLFRLKGCGKCGGDLALDEGDWLCLQCGTCYYVNLYSGTNWGHQETYPGLPNSQPPGQPGEDFPYSPHSKGNAAFVENGKGGFGGSVLAVGLAAVLGGLPAAAR
jgi:hypothetical protein